MTIDLEDQLTAGMRDEVSGLTYTRDVLGDATRRHRRRTVLHRSAYAAGVVGVAGALAAALTVDTGVPAGLGGSPGPIAERPSIAASPEWPQMRLAAAAAASENISYRVKVTTTNKEKLPPKGELPEPVAERWVTKGAFDPATVTGYLESPNTGLRPPMSSFWLQERLVDGVRYVGGLDGADPDNGKIVWSRFPEGRQTGLKYDDGLGASTDPQQLFRMLRQAGAKVTQSPGGGYHFEVTMQDSTQGVAADRLAGDVTIDADGRIRTVAYDRAVRWNAKGPEHTYHLHVLVELSDYGLPVKVAVPANARVIGR
ncbi:hypothetical protein [Micromonospora narathiwatensis]|uniref:Uncharacterized protein n=1 Tax=Micromonospora narathiwatensis TaxID=299146 RepID=A0A1A9AF91_9ACTN|nr:hypothetical protein [Micromonospora narathiwatensis]SBT54839.1 hypothetical protein GA0070621_5736 [Micromonospora narathiwatensis]